MSCAVSLAAIIRLHCLDFLIYNRRVDLLLLHVVVVGVFFSQCLLSHYTDYIGAIHLYVCVCVCHFCSGDFYTFKQW
jgi:hypothetical protein